MSESMTVEQARADFETWISKPPFEYSTARFGNGEYVYATVGFAWKAWQEAQAKMQSRVAELEAEKWNAQIAEGALLSVEKERDTLETDCDHANSQRAAAEQERDKWQEIANRWLAVSNVQARVIDALKQERDELLSRLPDGMKHCTIVFKECEKGHGWLTATNWVQHGCPTCERDELRRRVDELEKQNDELAAKLKTVIDCGDSCCDEYCKDEWDLAVNAAADKTLARIKAAAVREFGQWSDNQARSDWYGRTASDMAQTYANQIEGGA